MTLKKRLLASLSALLMMTGMLVFASGPAQAANSTCVDYMHVKTTTISPTVQVYFPVTGWKNLSPGNTTRGQFGTCAEKVRFLGASGGSALNCRATFAADSPPQEWGMESGKSYSPSIGTTFRGYVYTAC